MKFKTTILSLTFLLSGYLVSAQKTLVEPGTNIRVETGTTLDISGGNIVIKSDASGDASLIDFGSVTYSGGGQANVERYVTEDKWHFISSPVTNAVSGMFLADYLQQHDEGANLWTYITPTALPLDIMKGFALWSEETAPSTEVFEGTTNTGVQIRTFTQNGDGWNFMGNPYPSAIDWDVVTLPSELNGAFWLWDPTIGSSGDYVFYITGGGIANTTSQFIPSGQGFFVRAVAGAGNLMFDNDVRTHSTQDFYKSSGDEPMLILKGNGNSISSHTALRFIETATQDVDRLYDVYKLFSDSPEIPNLWTKSGGDELVLNTLPSITGNEKVPVWFRAGLPGTYSITAQELQTIDPSVPVYLEDKETGIIQDLRQNPVYNFTHSPINDREFIVWFTEVLGLDDLTFNKDILVYSSGSNLNVNFSEDFALKPDFDARITVYDLSGNLIAQRQTREINNTLTLPASSSFYIVKVMAGEAFINRKILIN